MDDVLERVLEWQRAGRGSALATIVGVERKAPRGPGATMAISAAREIAGSLSGGCVEPAIVEEADGVIASGEPRLLSFGISEDQAFAVGLACGGTIHVFLEKLGEPANRILAAARGEAAAGGGALVATVLTPGESGARAGAKRLVLERGGEPRGSSGAAAVDHAIDEAAAGAFRSGAPARATLGGADVFLQPLLPDPVLYVVGAVHPAAELCAAGKLVGFHVVVCDPRSPFATPERLPHADEIIREWPHEVLAERKPGARDAVCILTHDLKFDVPAIAAALDAGAGYVGAMGSKKTHAGRVSRLRELGRTEEELASVHAPIGLAIGADSPAEIALSIVAEIVAVRRGASSRQSSPAKA